MQLRRDKQSATTLYFNNILFWFLICKRLPMESKSRHKAKRKKVSDKKCPVADPLPESASFDQSFKYFKQRVPPPDFSTLVNPSHPELWENYGVCGWNLF